MPKGLRERTFLGRHFRGTALRRSRPMLGTPGSALRALPDRPHHSLTAKNSMKRTLSSESPSKQSQVNAVNNGTLEQDPNPQQQTHGADTRAPVMRAVAITNAPLPDQEVFTQALSHTTPVENPRNSAEDDNEIAWDIEYRADGINVVPQSRYQFELLLDNLKRSAQPQHLQIGFDSNSEVSWTGGICLDRESQRQLATFFKQHSKLKKFSLADLNYHASLSPSLIQALFENATLDTIKISGIPILKNDATEWHAVGESLARNTSLTHLHFYGVNNDPEYHDKFYDFLNLMTGALKRNTALKTLKFESMRLRGCGEAIAGLIAANSHLNELALIAVSVDQQDLAAVIDKVAESTTLRVFEMLETYKERSPRDLQELTLPRNILQKLATNNSLSGISLPKCIDIDTAAELLREKKSLKYLGLTWNSSFENFPEKLYHLFENMKQLESLQLSCLSSTHDMASKLPMIIKECISLKKLTVSEILPETLAPVLIENPQIQDIELGFANWLVDPTKVPDVSTIVALAKSRGQLMTFSLFNEQIPEQRIFDRGIKFPELELALAINRQNASNIQKAGDGISMMIGLHRHDVASGLAQNQETQVALPDLPTDITRQIAAAIARKLPQEDTQQIFDVTTRYAT